MFESQFTGALSNLWYLSNSIADQQEIATNINKNVFFFPQVSGTAFLLYPLSLITIEIKRTVKIPQTGAQCSEELIIKSNRTIHYHTFFFVNS